MFRGVIVFAALITACATAPGRPLPEQILSGAVDAETVDYGAVRFGGDATILPALQSALDAGVATLPECDARRLRNHSAAPWLMLAREAPDRETYTRDARALRTRLIELDSQADALAAGAPLASPRGDVSAATSYASRVASATDPRARELFARAARDQALRASFTASAWREGLPPAADALWMTAVGARLAHTDCANTAWLSEQLETLEWFDIATFGEQADNAAWIITQHADRTRDFQRMVLARLERLAPLGASAPSNAAYLADRIAAAENRPQRCGTQGRCAPEGGWRPLPIEDEANLDERRRALGLAPMADYVAGFAQLDLCPTPAAQ